jgi:putative peptidoglycan lipid II flippase
VWGFGLYFLGFPPAQVAVGWAVGTLLAGAAQFLVQVPALWREGWRPRLEWALHDPALRSMLALMAPATVGLAAVQVNIFVSTIFASKEQGALVWLQLAFRLLYLPIGVFGVAVGTIATTGLSRRAAEGDMGGLVDTLGRSLRLLAFLTVPSTAGLMVLSVPIARLLFERGHFTPLDSARTGQALTLYSIGLVAYTGVKVLAPAFYALGRPRVPLLASAAAVGTNLAVIAALHPTMGFRAIALGTALGSIANALVLASVFQVRHGGLWRQVATSSVARMVVAAGVMAVAAWFSARALTSVIGTEGLAVKLATGLGPVAAGAIVYFAACAALRVPEVAELLAVLRRRRRTAA